MLKTILIGAMLSNPAMMVSHLVVPVDRPAAEVGQAAKTHEGKVVSVADGKLEMSDKDGKNKHKHAITATAKILLDGKSAQLVDLKVGDPVKVTTTAEGVVTMVEATRAVAPTT